jgi:hypothetical protein
MKILLPSLLLLATTIASPAAGQSDDAITRKTLAGLKGIYILVEDVDDDVQRDGLSREQIRTDVELRLRQAGLDVLSELQYAAETGFPYLYVNVQTLKSSLGPYVYRLEVELKQSVTPIRNPSATLLAPTWAARAKLGIVGVDNVRSLRDDIRDMVDQFINAYLAANPKR